VRHFGKIGNFLKTAYLVLTDGRPTLARDSKSVKDAWGYLGGNFNLYSLLGDFSNNHLLQNGELNVDAPSADGTAQKTIQQSIELTWNGFKSYFVTLSNNLLSRV
jgi:hypothetical protein